MFLDAIYISQVSSQMVPHFLFMEINGSVRPTLIIKTIVTHLWQNKNSGSEYVDNSSSKQLEIWTNLGTLTKFRKKAT